MSLVSDIITGSFVDLAVIQPGETVTTAMQTDAFNHLNQGIGSLSAEGGTIPNQVVQTFNLSANVSDYTLGSGGTFATTGSLRAQKVTSWLARYSDMQRGGAPLALDRFAAEAYVAQNNFLNKNVKGILEALGGAISGIETTNRGILAAITGAAESMLTSPVPPTLTQIQGAMTAIVAALPTTTPAAAMTALIAAIPTTVNAPIPSLLGADTSYPLINVRVWPPPANTPGTIELGYWTPLAAFATVGDTVNLPPGWELILRSLLAAWMFSQYGRPSMAQAIFQAADKAKAAILQQNTMPEQPPAMSTPDPAAPSGSKN